MFKSRNVYPNGTPNWIMDQRGSVVDLWIRRREDEISVSLWKRVFG